LALLGCQAPSAPIAGRDAGIDAGLPADAGRVDAGQPADAGRLDAAATDLGRRADGGGVSTAMRHAGVHHISENWGEQNLLDEVDPSFIRINITGEDFRRFGRDGERFNWATLDGVIDANSGRTLFATIYPRHRDLSSEDSPKIVTTAAEYAELQAWFDALALRFGERIRWWQLDNEVNAPTSWPADRFDDYARQLAMLDAAITARSPAARTVVAGFTGSSSAAIPGRVRQLLTAVVAGMPNPPDAIDIHHHRLWREGALLGARVRAYRDHLNNAHNLAAAEILVTENSTHFDDPPDRPAQTVEEQAVYAIESSFSAWAAGASVCVIGVLQDRRAWRGEALHRFSLNGLFYHPQKAYTGGARQGPKLWAYSAKLLTSLSAGRPLDGFVRHPGSPAGIERIDVAGSPPYTVIWWERPGVSPTLETATPGAATEVLVIDTIPQQGRPWPIDDPITAFATEARSAPGGRLALTLESHRPVIILPR
jgi:hypothetical protein